MTIDQAEQYRRIKIALVTGWTLEYIDQLGALDESHIVEILEAEAVVRKGN